MTDYYRGLAQITGLAPLAGRRAAGFTLIELMIVVAIIAILAAIAYPSYQDHVIKTRRNAAAACALEGAQWMERYYTTNLTYLDSGGNPPSLPQTECADDLADHYTFALSTTTATTRASYVVEATPQGNQAAKDTKCATLSINQAGLKTVSTSTPARDCW